MAKSKKDTQVIVSAKESTKEILVKDKVSEKEKDKKPAFAWGKKKTPDVEVDADGKEKKKPNAFLD